MADTEIARRRLANQRIEGEKFERPEEVVRWLGAMQAQDYPQALWAVGLRLKSATVADVERAINVGKIVRTWPMRGTLHFVPPEDVRWRLELSASRILARDGRRLEQLGLDLEIIERCGELFYEALRGNRRLTRPEMVRVLEEAGIGTEKQRGYHILWYLSQDALICPGPMQGKQQTFVLLDEWVPHTRELSREDSLAELAGRYIASHGPATVHDFAWWSGLTVTDARLGIEATKTQLVSEKIDGKEYWTAGDAPDQTARDGSGVHLLPAFDEYLLGYKDRGAALTAEDALRVIPGKNGIFLPTIVVEGVVVGTWKRKLKKSTVDITLSPFADPDDLDERATEAARSYSDFVGLPLS
ncbi:MAG: winged helix DNA-binding domain-containing protein [Actinomycetota bacterium]|nr:winged helix DNA-binding domain-containing protein [Actinomycetota bacterium]